MAIYEALRVLSMTGMILKRLAQRCTGDRFFGHIYNRSPFCSDIPFAALDFRELLETMISWECKSDQKWITWMGLLVFKEKTPENGESATNMFFSVPHEPATSQKRQTHNALARRKSKP